MPIYFKVDETKNLNRPITTYGGQATKKRGINRDAHAVIYTSSQEPPLLHGESRLNKRAIKVIAQGQTLTEDSRVNFEKPYTVEYNLRVSLIGQVDQSSMPLLRVYSEDVLS
jgi:hypothetical protein